MTDAFTAEFDDVLRKYGYTLERIDVVPNTVTGTADVHPGDRRPGRTETRLEMTIRAVKYPS